jgi:ribosome-associated toxin RatA of RatAB toxin-antitoxin module
MTILKKSALVPYTSSEMFALVADIERYPEFLPWCKLTEVLFKEGNEVKASITLAVKGLEKNFTTKNTFKQDEWLDMNLLKGPFSHLHGQWKFHKLGNVGCKISLDMDFEFSNKLLSMTLGPIFTHIVNTLIDSFIKRAGDIYGKNSR